MRIFWITIPFVRIVKLDSNLLQTLCLVSKIWCLMTWNLVQKIWRHFSCMTKYVFCWFVKNNESWSFSYSCHILFDRINACACISSPPFFSFFWANSPFLFLVLRSRLRGPFGWPFSIFLQSLLTSKWTANRLAQILFAILFGPFWKCNPFSNLVCNLFWAREHVLSSKPYLFSLSCTHGRLSCSSLCAMTSSLSRACNQTWPQYSPSPFVETLLLPRSHRMKDPTIPR